MLYVSANEIAEELGDSKVVNMVMLGAFVNKTGIVRIESIFNALTEILPAKRQNLLKINQEALKRGAAAVK
jgi:2-oxoglutarate ferredoxin oxidoreductase subunit gamma